MPEALGQIKQNRKSKIIDMSVHLRDSRFNVLAGIKNLLT